MWQRLSLFILLLGLSALSLASQDDDEIQKFFLKSSKNLQKSNYSPLRILYEINENSFQNTQMNKIINASINTTVEIFSNLVISQPSKAGLKFVEKIQCEDVLIQIIQNQEIDADFGLYITFSNESKGELVTAKNCENSDQLLIISLTINSKNFLDLEKASQVKILSSTIASIIFKDKLQKNQLLSEVEDYLKNNTIEDIKTLSASGCNPPISNCISCITPSKCASCSASYLPNADNTQCCAGSYCETCNSGFECDSCIENFIFYNGQCHSCPQNCAQCNKTACVECDPGFYAEEGIMCLPCSTGCETCNPGPSSGSICNQCYDPDHSQITNGECSCTKANQIYNQNNVCACQPGYYLDSNGVCQLCNIGCQTCTSPNQCSACFDSDFMISNSDGSCSCKTNELTYNTTTHTCTCPIGEYPDQQTGLCDSCQDTCAYCVSYSICLSCIDNSILYNTGKGNCICQDGSKVYDNITKTCVSCPNGKYPSFGVCYACGSGCNSCSYYNECTQCYSGMHLSADNTGCICDAAYTLFDPATNTCTDCDPTMAACDGNCLEGCKICTSPGTCQACYDAENMVNKNGACSCTNPDQKFSFTKRKCVDNSSAKGLALAWILALYAAI